MEQREHYGDSPMATGHSDGSEKKKDQPKPKKYMEFTIEVMKADEKDGELKSPDDPIFGEDKRTSKWFTK